MESYGAVSFSGETKAGPFYEQIRTGRKTLTLWERRKDGRPHVKEGNSFKLYWKMRTKECFLIGVAECLKYEPVKIADVWYDRDFARRDGFEDLDEFRDNWFPSWRNLPWLDGVLEAYHSLKDYNSSTEVIMNWGRRYGKSSLLDFLELGYMKIEWQYPLLSLG